LAVVDERTERLKIALDNLDDNAIHFFSCEVVKISLVETGYCWMNQQKHLCLESAPACRTEACQHLTTAQAGIVTRPSPKPASRLYLLVVIKAKQHV
jgi:hypothetical protein